MDFASDEVYYWLTGITDGEGCFAVKKDRFAFQLRLRSDEIAVLKRIQRAFLGAGMIYLISNQPSRLAGIKRRDNLSYEVFKQTELKEKVIPVFDKFPLRSKKRIIYAAWKRGFLRQQKEPDRTARATIRMETKARLKELRDLNT